MLDLRDRKKKIHLWLDSFQSSDVSFGFDNWIMNPGIFKDIFIQIAYVPSHHILTRHVSLLENTHKVTQPNTRKQTFERNQGMLLMLDKLLYFTFWLLLFCHCLVRFKHQNYLVWVKSVNSQYYTGVTTHSKLAFLGNHSYASLNSDNSSRAHLPKVSFNLFRHSDLMKSFQLHHTWKKTVLNYPTSICSKLGVRMGVVVAQ